MKTAATAVVSGLVTVAFGPFEDRLPEGEDDDELLAIVCADVLDAEVNGDEILFLTERLMEAAGHEGCARLPSDSAEAVTQKGDPKRTYPFEFLSRPARLELEAASVSGSQQCSFVVECPLLRRHAEIGIRGHTNVSIAFVLESGEIRSVTALVQAAYHQDSEAYAVFRRAPILVGAAVRLSSDRATWQGITRSVASEVDGSVTWTSLLDEPSVLDGTGSLDRAIVSHIADWIQSALVTAGLDVGSR